MSVLDQCQTRWKRLEWMKVVDPASVSCGVLLIAICGALRDLQRKFELESDSVGVWRRQGAREWPVISLRRRLRFLSVFGSVLVAFWGV